MGPNFAGPATGIVCLSNPPVITRGLSPTQQPSCERDFRPRGGHFRSSTFACNAYCSQDVSLNRQRCLLGHAHPHRSEGRHNIQVDPNFTVNDLKKRVHFRTGIPPDEQRFLFNNNMLQDDCALLSECHIQDQSILYLIRCRTVASGWSHSP
ncbi:uncharacterized protein EI90DRAFT_700676 [Cantharellus anzutake]|uniref:uncharacterized protein n=1 Tax=Cantharellus anzutake TaxID=1750568 RepID=UPI0019035278|nr:uncharacterized protein EI90DRAFT_700676 [Cantharellus anzutake]KAF8332761.1 hypothetical protein EI90DRAFT_700676 [Cantharellus anzutake]